MRTYDASVRKRAISFREHCHANPSDLRRIGRGVGHQVRIRRSAGLVGLYTVAQSSMEDEGTVGMGRTGRNRLQGADGFDAIVDAEVVDQRRTDDEARADGEFVERLTPGQGRALAVIAPHGGDIEKHTDEQAVEVAARLNPIRPWVWVCKGWGCDDDAFERWHITSTDISPASFPLLRRTMRSPFAHAVSFHGFDRVPGPDVRIGGLADGYLKASVRDAVQDQFRQKGKPWDAEVVQEGERFDGLDPDNIVNRLARGSGGLQVEQSARARRSMNIEIADAVASVYQALFAGTAPAPRR